MAFDQDNWESTKRLFRGVGKVLKSSLKFTGETLYEGYALGADKPQRFPVARQPRVMRPSPASQPRVSARKSLGSGFKVHNPYTQGKKASHNQLIDNPFPRNVSEELGIPHRQKISAREYELIRKDMIRRGLH
jgi:hypothetical protein